MSRCVAFVLGFLREQQTAHRHSLAVQHACGDKAIATVVALAAHNCDARAVTPASERNRRSGDGAPRSLHEHEAGGPRRDRRLVGRRHLAGRQEWFHIATLRGSVCLYSTVTLFARLRGLSGDSPRSLATKYASI